jgi:hypothetical protein
MKFELGDEVIFDSETYPVSDFSYLHDEGGISATERNCIMG